ncbi:aldo/keto reductase [Crassaminicella profunda]|uniref:aldo/keto reductase n=1 Tax=Crassaminicella profunda TaxID=1286698 RepID=UPI001CA6A924|nr:aldo/keto reductase [Crassaminicella profunda]QZY56311.1 aldo/keto reductase [Crassaminicella profunda]
MPQIALGTAQLGLNYGINNKTGKPAMKESFSIFDTAYKNGIRVLDTAYVYGNSEKIIGDYLTDTKRKFTICTKLPHISGSNQHVINFLNKSLKNLNVKQVEYYLLHNMIEVSNQRIIDELIKLKEKNLVGKIGVSVYDIKDVEVVLQKDIFNVIQIPMNIFDRRIIQLGYLEELKRRNIEVFIRSIFLQGLFFSKLDEIPFKLEKAKKYLKIIKDFSNKFQIDIADLIFGWFKYNDYGDFILVGVETNNQLERNIKAFHKKIDHKIIYEFNQLVDAIKVSYDSIIIDPRRW